MPPPNQPPFDPKDHLLPRHAGASGEGGPPAHKSSTGPIVGTIIIVVLLVVGALYFWGAQLNQRDAEDQLPLIPGNDSSTTIQ
ncbi:MAG: hypothetical protein Q7S50_03155 [bacterium]|nr:hypothetical protein [bacterium]